MTLNSDNLVYIFKVHSFFFANPYFLLITRQFFLSITLIFTLKRVSPEQRQQQQ